MPPKTLLLRQAARITARPIHPVLLRCYSSKGPPQKTPPNTPPNTPVHPTQDVLPSVSEEASMTASITGETTPELDQGTPIQEIINRTPEARKNAPAVLKTPPSSRSYSTTATTATTATIPSDPIPSDPIPSDPILSDPIPSDPLPPGAKFPLPTLPIPARSNLNYRYSPLVSQVTNFLMRDGKKATAQSTLLRILSHLRTRPAPRPAVPAVPLIPGTPPLQSLPLDPLSYLQTAIDSVAPLMKLISVKGAGGTKDVIPSPLNIRQRRRTALTWIVAAADKKRDRARLAERVADELVAVVEGRSSVWERRNAVHRQAIGARANVSTGMRRPRAKNAIRFPYN